MIELNIKYPRKYHTIRKNKKHNLNKSTDHREQQRGIVELKGQPEIDETDVKILKILQADPRTSYSQIAETCETSIDKA